MDISEQKSIILASKKTDMQKLKEIFDLDKENIRKNDVNLYYALLGVLDTAKINKWI